jgi:hypothetical protein
MVIYETRTSIPPSSGGSWLILAALGSARGGLVFLEY